MSGKITACQRLGHTGHLGRSPFHEHLAAGLTGAGSEIDDPVSGPDQVQVVLDNHYGVARVGQTPQHLKKFLDVREVKARGWARQGCRASDP